MTTRSSTSLSLRTAFMLFAGATCFAAPAVAQGIDLPVTVTPLPGGCPAGPFLTGVVTPSYVTLSVTTAPCEFGPVIALFGIAFQQAAPMLQPWGCPGSSPCTLNLLPAFTAYDFGFPPAVSHIFPLPPVPPIWPVYAQALVIGTYWSLSNPVVIQ